MRLAALAIALLPAAAHGALYICDGPARQVMRSTPCPAGEALVHAYRTAIERNQPVRAPVNPAAYAPTQYEPAPVEVAPSPARRAAPGTWSEAAEQQRERAATETKLDRIDRRLRDVQRRAILRDSGQ